MRDFHRWSRVMSAAGGVGLVVGSLDPMEGSLLILPGSALLAAGSWLGHEDRRVVGYRVWSFILIALGVAALFGLSAVGGIGGNTGRSAWWALLFLPYVVGWSLDIWGPGISRWVTVAGIVIGAWYLAICALMLRRASGAPGSRPLAAVAVLAAVGLWTIVACAMRLRAARSE